MSNETAREDRLKRPILGGRGGKAMLIMAGIVALGLTAGCGKKDDPEAPGPNPTYPKTYPTS